MSSRWSPYFDKTAGLPPRGLYLDAVTRFAAPGDAVDLGYGAGNETVDLLSRGWRVHAVDSDPAAERRLRARTTETDDLTVVAGTLEDTPIPEADLVHAGSSVFFATPERFDELWHRIITALRPGGRFAGNLLGVRDDWAGNAGITTVTSDRCAALTAGLEVEFLREQDEDGMSMSGPKHWHAFHLILRKP